LFYGLRSPLYSLIVSVFIVMFVLFYIQLFPLQVCDYTSSSVQLRGELTPDSQKFFIIIDSCTTSLMYSFRTVEKVEYSCCFWLNRSAVENLEQQSHDNVVIEYGTAGFRSP